MPTLPPLPLLQSGDKRAIARALAAIETQAHSVQLAALLDAACAAARAHVIGLTGPPGVGKSTLTNVLVARARARGATVGVLAVDPSSRRTGGALLGDRARIATDPSDRGVFVRSMAAREPITGPREVPPAAPANMRAAPCPAPPRSAKNSAIPAMPAVAIFQRILTSSSTSAGGF